MNTVVIIDYGMGNVKSVQRGLESVGATAVLSSDPDLIANADRVVLPGVGAFEDGMKGLKESGLDDAIHWFCRKGNPLLGICLGMQMLLDQSKENGKHKGLGLISGTVESIPRYSDNLFVRKTPLIGWCVLRSPVHQKDWGGTCLRNTKVGEYFYFVHSFMVIPENNEDLLAQCMYGDFPVTAAVRRDNVTGLQFHPEKSGESGLIILREFVK